MLQPYILRWKKNRAIRYENVWNLTYFRDRIGLRVRPVPPRSALIVKDRLLSTPLCDFTNGFSVDEPVLIASVTKLVTAFTIYSVTKKDSTLHAHSFVRDWIDDWPRVGHASHVQLHHLLSFTSGIEKREEKDMCSEDGAHFTECLSAIGSYNFVHAPGDSFLYVSWHLYVAAAMAMLASNRSLTKESWVDMVYSHVYVPSGLEHVRPDFPERDCLLFGSFLCWLHQRDVPHFSGGLRITGRQLSAIMAMIFYNSTLSRDFLEDAARNATVAPFSHGHWIKRSVHYSSGMHGTYAWIDRDQQYYAVLVRSWWTELRSILHWSFGLTAGLFCVMTVCCCRDRTLSEYGSFQST